MSRPQYDPRLTEKNFAMPMNPAPMSVVNIIHGTPGPWQGQQPPQIARKEGVPHVGPQLPAYGPRKREPQETVTIRPRGEATTGYAHPWMIEVDADLVLRVNYGAVSATVISSGALPFPYNVDCQSSWDLTASPDPLFLKDDPFNPTGEVGTAQLATSTTYGVWMAVNTYFSVTSIDNPFGNETEIAYYRPWLADVNTCSIVVTDTQTSPTVRYSGNTGDIGFFLGQVVVDANDAVTIRQQRKSDIHVPLVLWPWGIVFP